MPPAQQNPRGTAAARDAATGGAQKRKRGAAAAGFEEAEGGQAEVDDAAGSTGDARAGDGAEETRAAEAVSHGTDDEHVDGAGDSGEHEQQASAKRRKAGADTGDLLASARSGARSADKVLHPCHAPRP